jgi:activating signal cointegrator complex subunit 1
LASDVTANVVVEVTTNDASSSKNNLSFGYSSTKVIIEDNMEVSGFNKDLAGSNISGTYSSSIEVYHSHASK